MKDRLNERKGEFINERKDEYDDNWIKELIKLYDLLCIRLLISHLQTLKKWKSQILWKMLIVVAQPLGFDICILK